AVRMGAPEAAKMSAAAAQKALAAMDETKEPAALASLAKVVGLLAARLGPAEASATAQKVLDARTWTSDQSVTPELGRSGALLVAQLGRREGPATVQAMLDVVAWNTDPKGGVVDRLPGGPSFLDAIGLVTTLAAQLGPVDAAAAAKKLLDAMGKSPDAN